MEINLLQLLFAFTLGVLSIGCFTWRTLAVHAGDVAAVVASSAIVSIAGVFGTGYLIEKDWAGYAAFSAGSAAVTVTMAVFNRWRKHGRRTTSNPTNPPQR